MLGGSSAGVFYGTQTVLQMLRSTPGHRTLPGGEARDIARSEAAARKYHATIIPEVEMPAHAGAILKARPDFALNCLNFNTTLAVTKPDAREFTALIREFAPLFSPEFHIATDEYPGQVNLDRCPTLVDYAQAHGVGSRADIFVSFINDMNSIVRSLGKRTVIWNWWDVNKDRTIAPDTNIKAQTWTSPAIPGLDGHSLVPVRCRPANHAAAVFGDQPRELRRRAGSIRLAAVAARGQASPTRNRTSAGARSSSPTSASTGSATPRSP